MCLLWEMLPERTQRNTDFLNSSSHCSIHARVRCPLETPDLLDAQTLEISDCSGIVGGYLCNAVTVIAESELASQLNPFL